MKRLLLVAASMLCLIVCFFACSDLQNLSEPKKVVVKPGDAKYSIPFGGYSVAFDDYINVTKLQESLAGSDGEDSGDTKPQLSVYDYQDPTAKNLQQFIVEYPIAGISLNPDDYLGDITDFLQNFKLSDDGDSQISIPINDVFERVSKSLASCKTEVDVPLETLNGAIDGYSKEGNRITGLTIPSIREEISTRQIGFDYGGNGFIKQAIIKSGTFTIDCELPHDWSGVTAKVELSVSGAIEGVQFKDAGKTDAFLIRQEADLSGKTINDKEKDLNITGTVTLEFNNATIVLDDDGTVPDLPLVCTSQIEKIRDAQIYLGKVLGRDDIASPDEPPILIPVHIPKYVKNCKIVRLDMQTAIDTNLGGIIKNLYMAPKISSDYMNFDASGSYNDIFDNANGLRITKDVDEGWEGFYLVKDGTPPPQEEIDIAVDFDIRGDNYNPNSPDNYIEEEDTITITEFDLTKASDTEYYLKPTFAAPEDSTMFECDALELQIDENNAPFAGSIETGLSIGDMLGDLVDSGDNSALGNFVEDLIGAIELQGIEGYLYVTAPKTDGDGAIDFANLLSPITGYVGASYELEDSNKGTEVLIETELSIKNNVPSFASLADENRLITDDSIFSEKYYSARTKEGSLTNIINQKANNLKFDYDISFGDGESGTISLDRNQIRALQNAAKVAGANVEIAMSIAVVLPLRLNITDAIVVDNIMALAGDGEDVDFLGDEDSDSDFSEYTDYTEALKSLELWYQFKNPLGLKIDALFSEKNEFISQKPMHFDNEKHSISLETKEIDKILTASSFIPRISMTLEKGEVSVTRNAELKMNAALVIKTDNDAGIEFEL